MEISIIITLIVRSIGIPFCVSFSKIANNKSIILYLTNTHYKTIITLIMYN